MLIVKSLRRLKPRLCSELEFPRRNIAGLPNGVDQYVMVGYGYNKCLFDSGVHGHGYIDHHRPYTVGCSTVRIQHLWGKSSFHP